MGTRYNRFTEAVLTSNHDVCFRAKIRKNNGTPVHTSFTIYIVYISFRKFLLYRKVVKSAVYGKDALVVMDGIPHYYSR